MALTTAQRSAATQALEELRDFQNRCASKLNNDTYAISDSTIKQVLGNVEAMDPRIDELERRLGQVDSGEKSFQWWAEQAKDIQEALKAFSGLAEGFGSWALLSDAAAATVQEVKDDANAAKPLAIGAGLIVGLVALAYLVFTLGPRR